MIKISDKEYFAHPAESQSYLKHILRSPAHYLAKKNAPKDDDDKALVIGSATHCMVLEPEEFQNRFVVLNKVDYRTNETKEAVKNNPGKKLLSMADMVDINGMTESVLRHSVARQIMAGAQREMAFFWKEEAYDIECKAKIDLINVDAFMIADFKTCKNAKPSAFANTAFSDDYMYDFQGAFYARAAQVFTGIENWDVYFIAVEKEPPYAVAVFKMSDNDLFKAKFKVRSSYGILAESRQKDYFPAYEEIVHELVSPRWTE